MSNDDFTTRLDALEKRLANLTVGDLPMSALQRKLEASWQPNASMLLEPKSITADLLATGAAGEATGSMHCYLGATTSVGHGSRVPFNTVEFDVSNAYDKVNAIYVAPVAGIYRFSWHLIATASLPSGYYFLSVCRRISTGAADEREGQLMNTSTASGSAPSRSTGTCLFRAAAGDQFGINASNATGVATDVLGGNPGYSFFEAELVGRL